MSFEATLNKYRPYALTALRVSTALAFAAHGTQKMFNFPAGRGEWAGFDLFSLMGAAGVLEVFGGLAILLGLFTRPVAFILAGQMAYAFWFMHAANAGTIIPVANGGDGAMLFCFIFFYLVFSGPGAFSVDGMLKSRRA